MRLCSLVMVLVSCVPVASAADPEKLTGTGALTTEGDLSLDNLERVDRFLLREIAASPAQRAEHWQSLIDDKPTDRYEPGALAPREMLKRLVGAVDKRVPARDLALVAT